MLSDDRDTWKAAQAVKDQFQAKTFNVKRIQRGMPEKVNARSESPNYSHSVVGLSQDAMIAKIAADGDIHV